MKKLIGYLFEEEESSQCLKILSQFTVKKTKIHLQRFETFCQRENERFLQQIKILIINIPAPDHLDELLGHFSFFSETNERTMEATSSQTQ